MKKIRITTGVRVFASFAIVLAIMAAMTAIARWRQHGAEQAMARLVNESLAKQLLISEQLGAIRLNGMRAITIARSDSMELGDYFKAQLSAGEKDQARIGAGLAAAADRRLHAANRTRRRVGRGGRQHHGRDPRQHY